MATLYTPAILALATSLATWPWDAALSLRGEARSASCGSTLRLGLAVDAGGAITRIGMLPRACAIGQAAAAIFAARALGLTAADIGRSRDAIARWLAGEGALPDWPGLDAIALARHYPARHGAILLPWRAAGAALEGQVHVFDPPLSWGGGSPPG